MPVIRDCLQAAQKAYQDVVANSEIQSTFDQLEAHRNKALESGADLYTALTEFSERNIRDRERANLADELQQLKSMQAVVDTLQRVELFEEKGYEDPVFKAIKAKISGSPYRVSRGRENTETKMVRARSTFERQFCNDLNNELGPLWFSKEYQTEIADALLATVKGEKVEGQFGKLADVVRKYQVRLNEGRRAMGIDINELEDRIAPNVHNQAKMMKLTRAERKEIKATGQKEYEYLFNRWRNFIYPLLDKKRTFIDRGIDPNDMAQVSPFLKDAFDNLTNKGKVTQDKINIANKVKQPRVLHWEDGKSLVEYNNQFGSGALQDSITRELSFGFGQLEMMKDWGVTPLTTLERTLKVLEENPTYKDRFNKASEGQTLGRYLKGLTRNDADYAGTIDQIGRNIRAWETMSKLGEVTLSSIPDLGLLANEAARLGVPTYAAIPEALSKVIFGMSQAEKEALSDLLDTGRRNQMGAIAKFYDTDYSPSSLAGKGVRLMHKLNGLEKWDHGFNAATTSMNSRYFAQNRHISWDMLTVSDRETLGLYNINKPEWETIRRSGIKAAEGKLYITPDSIQDVPNDVVKEILLADGANKVTEMRIKQFKDDTENKLRDYFQDRNDHVILRPDVVDRDILSFGMQPQNAVARAALKMFSQFKMYGLAYVRKPVYEKLFGKGAKDFNEALFSGKADYVGIAKMSAYMMALSYASATLKNAVRGLSPPSLTSPKTWLGMLGESLGFYGMVLRLDPNDLLGSTAKSLAGPALTDLSKLVRLGSHFIGDLVSGDDFSASKRALYGFASNNIPLIRQAYTIKVLNDLLFNEWQDTASPGQRERHLQELEQDQGVVPIF